MNEWVLRIRRLRIKDFGHYQCQAYNNQSKTLYKQDVLLTGNENSYDFNVVTSKKNL